MIRVTIWNENVQERGRELGPQRFPGDDPHSCEMRQMMAREADEIRLVHPDGIHQTLARVLADDPALQIRTATLDEPEAGLSEAVLAETDVLVYWAHIAHDELPDAVADRIRDHVLGGMGLIALHSAHPSKPMQRLLGTTGRLLYGRGSFCRVWNLAPDHPIAKGLPPYFELPEDEVYCEPFDIPQPEAQIFLSWYRSGEVFRAGNAWQRGKGKIFYLALGHETYAIYDNPNVAKILHNAVHWAAPAQPVTAPEPCVYIEKTPEELAAQA